MDIKYEKKCRNIVIAALRFKDELSCIVYIIMNFKTLTQLLKY